MGLKEMFREFVYCEAAKSAIAKGTSDPNVNQRASIDDVIEIKCAHQSDPLPGKFDPERFGVRSCDLNACGFSPVRLG